MSCEHPGLAQAVHRRILAPLRRGSSAPAASERMRDQDGFIVAAAV
jgi:hypothetical protein